MLKKKNKLNSSEIKTFKQSEGLLSSDILSVKISNTLHKETKYTVIVSKKISKKAVVRNKIKRRVYNALKNIPIKTNVAMMVYTKKQIVDTPYKSIENTLKELLEKYI